MLWNIGGILLNALLLAKSIRVKYTLKDEEIHIFFMALSKEETHIALDNNASKIKYEWSLQSMIS